MPPVMSLAVDRDIVVAARDLGQCLFQNILPLWSVVGLDHAHGGFAETLTWHGRAGTGPRRVRVSARQVYAFATAEELGWNGVAARACVQHGYRFLCGNTSAHGFLFHSLDGNGAVLDSAHDLYDQAFLLLAYAHAHRIAGDGDGRARALDLLYRLQTRFATSAGGFVDRLDAVGPLRANPHMHLLEAALAWIEQDDAPEWRAFADELVDLFQTRFFDRRIGAVLEDFDHDWRPLADGARYRIEPGHNFEWAWLLMRWEHLTGGDAGGLPAAMIRFSENNGVDPGRRVAVNAVWEDGLMADGNARLWPQTERLKAWLAVAARSQPVEAAEAERRATEAAQTLLRYLRPSTAGLWHDVMAVDGSLESAPSPASSFYHIIGAIRELLVYCGGEVTPSPFATRLAVPWISDQAH